MGGTPGGAWFGGAYCCPFNPPADVGTSPELLGLWLVFNGATLNPRSIEFLFSDRIGGPGLTGPLFKKFASGIVLSDGTPLLLLFVNEPLLGLGLVRRSERGGIVRPPVVVGDAGTTD